MEEKGLLIHDISIINSHAVCFNQPTSWAGVDTGAFSVKHLGQHMTTERKHLFWQSLPLLKQ